MSQDADAAQGAADDWEFDLGETVVVLWLVETTGLIIGRSEFLRADQQYQVEHSDANGRLTTVWVDGDAIDHKSSTH